MKAKTKKIELRTLNNVQEEWEKCKKCTIGETARNHVFWDFIMEPYPYLLDLSDGLNVDIVMVGEGPGQKEDIEGFPFVGPAGQLLRKAINDAFEFDKIWEEEIGEERLSIALINLVLCRPYANNPRGINNREPTSKEIANCRHRLEETIQLLNPTTVVALGNVPNEYLMGMSFNAQVMYPYNYESLRHPSFIARQGENTIFYSNYVQRLKEVFQRTWKIKNEK